MKKTAEDYRNDAAACSKNALASNLYLRKADITEMGNTDIFLGLYEGTRRVKAKLIKTKFGECWLINEDETDLIAKRGKPFLPHSENSRILKGLGLREARERAPAWACMDGKGYGNSGSAWVISFRTGSKWGEDATLVEEGA